MIIKRETQGQKSPISGASGQMWLSPVVSGTRLERVWTNWRVTCANTAKEPLALTRVYKKAELRFQCSQVLKATALIPNGRPASGSWHYADHFGPTQSKPLL